MKNLYVLILFLLFFAAGVRTEAACPVTISAGGPTVFCTGDSVLLTATTGTGYLYQWKRNAINISGATTQTYMARQSGNFSVTVTVVSPACTTSSNTIVVTAEAPLSVSITNPGFSMCGSSTDVLEAPYGSSYLYQWYEDNHVLPNTNSYQIQTGHNGNYTVAVTNTCGTYTSPTFVFYNPSYDLNPYGWIQPDGPTSFCAGGGVTLYTGMYFSGYQWFKDGIALAGETGTSYTATAAGTYVLRLTDYCWWNYSYSNFYSNYITTTVQPGSFPTANISAGGPTTFCAGGSVTIQADTGSGWSYAWHRNGSYISGATSSSYTATLDGTYGVQVSNPCGALLSNTLAVTVIPQTVFIALIGPATICNGASATMTAGSAGPGGTYQWKLNGSNITGATGSSYAATVQGSYTCTITNSCGTFTSNTRTITISGTCSTGLKFDGGNDYAKIPHHASTDFGTGNFTLEAWVNLDVSQTAIYPTVLSNRYQYYSGYWIYFNNGRLTVLVNNISTTLGPDLRDNACHHIAVSRITPTGTYIYLDGALLGTLGTAAPSVSSLNFILIGNDPYYSGTSYAALKGNIMEVRLWNIGRTLTDIQNTRNIALSGTEPGLVGYYRLDDGTGQVVNDYSSTNNDGQLGSSPLADTNDPVFAGACALSGCTLPPAAISAGGPVTFCAGSSVTLSANTGTGLTYQWRRNGINIANATAPTYVADTTGSYVCAVNNACGFSVSNSIAVVELPVSATISAEGGVTSFCAGATVLLSASDGGPGAGYQWKLNGVDIPGATSSVYTNSVAGSFTCSITNSCGTFLSNVLVLTVTPVCNSGLLFDGSNDRVTIADSTIYNLGTGDFTAEAWIKADVSQSFSLPIIFGNRGTATNGFLVYLTNGQLSLRLGGINVAQVGADLRDNLCHHVTVTRLGNDVTYYVDGIIVYANTSVNFSQSISSSHALWIGSDQPNPNPFKGVIREIRYWNLARTQTQIVAAKDTFLVGNEPGLIGYWRMNEGNGQTVNDYSAVGRDGVLGSTTAVETLDPSSIAACPLTGCVLPVATITPAGSTTICSGGFVTLNAATGAGYSWQWKLNGGNISGATASSYAAGTAGVYSCLITNSCGSSISGTITVTVVAPTATITASGSTTFCTGGSVTLNATTGAGFTWQWKLNGGNILGATSSTYNATAAGNYTCAITNVCGALTSNTITVTVNTLPPATISAGGSTTFCLGGSVTLTANTGAGLTWQWKLNGGNIPGATLPSYNATATGNYTCVVTNSCGGTTSNSIAVTVNTAPSATITAGGPTTFCTGGLVTLNANTGAGLTYQWQLNGGILAGATASSYAATGAGNYTCVVTNGCGSTTSNTIAVNVNTVPLAAITAGGPTTFCAGGSVTLNANTGAGLTYQWKLNGSNIGGATSSSYNATAAGTYTCQVSNACGGPVSNSISVTVLSIPASPGVINGLASGICENTTDYTIAAVAQASAYTWTVPSGVTINSGQGTTSLNVTYPPSFSSGSITVNASNTCGTSGTTNLSLTSILAPAGTISGLQLVCDHQSYIYAIAPVPGATNYTWTVPTKARISQGQGTNQIQVKMFKYGGNITVTASNNCMTSTISVLPIAITTLNCGPVRRNSGMLDAEVFPNPSSTYFSMTVYSDDDSPCVFILRDITGRIIERRESVTPGRQIEFGSQMANGIYLAEIRQGEERKVIRVVKSE